MKITKIGHSCILIEKEGKKLLIDPGKYTFDVSKQKVEDLQDVDLIYYTHEHGDHCDVDILRTLSANKEPEVIANESVAKKLKENDLKVEIIKAGQKITQQGFNLSFVECPHEPLPIPRVENIGLVVDDKFFHLGDSLHPKTLPNNLKVAAITTFSTFANLVDIFSFAKKLKPEYVIPVHDTICRYPHFTDKYLGFMKDMGIKGVKETIEI